MNKKKVIEYNPVKKLNEFLKRFITKDSMSPNKEFYERWGYRQDKFYHFRKKLIGLKRIHPRSMEVVDNTPITEEEYASTPYPYSEAKIKNKEKKAKPRVKEAETFLTNPITFHVQDKRDEEDMIKISVNDFTKIIIKLVKEGGSK